jgi:hypothetical protein
VFDISVIRAVAGAGWLQRNGMPWGGCAREEGDSLWCVCCCCCLDASVEPRLQMRKQERLRGCLRVLAWVRGRMAGPF